MTNQTSSLPVLRLMPRHDRRVRAGYPWVFSNEIAMTPEAKDLPLGATVRLQTADGKNIGQAMFNPHTLIAARLWGRDGDTPPDKVFFLRRIRRALSLRERLFDAPFYRLAHAEADGLPGLVIDRFDDVLTVQMNTAGMDAAKTDIIAALVEALSPRAIVLKNDSPARETEGLGLSVEVAHGNLSGPVEVLENGCRFVIDPLEGQKTGWFYDQRPNRAFMASLSAGARVLDLYSYLGGFAIEAAKAGAREVIAVDRSEGAIEMAAQSAKLNSVENICTFRKAEAFEEMERLGAANEKFDVVIVDPPAFIKSRKDMAAGLRGYRKMTRLASKLVRPGGFLFAASCSHNASLADFSAAVAEGLSEAERSGRILYTGGAGPDHPVHPHLPESAYLKALVLQLD